MLIEQISIHPRVHAGRSCVPLNILHCDDCTYPKRSGNGTQEQSQCIGILLSGDILLNSLCRIGNPDDALIAVSRTSVRAFRKLQGRDI